MITKTSRPESIWPRLSLAAMGVVYGDIGTSPIYAFRESLSETTFFLGRERVLATNSEEMAVWCDRLCGVMGG